MGAIFTALQSATVEQRHSIVVAAYAALPVRSRSVTRAGYTITLVGQPTVDMRGLLQLICRITRVSDGAVVTPRDLNPVVVRFPPYLVEGAGDVTIDGRVYKEDPEAALLGIIGPLIDKVA